jgi:hypothetical protein
LADDGPKYQYGSGCLSDQLLGGFLALAAGLSDVVDVKKAQSALGAIHGHNLRADLHNHCNPHRSTFAFGDDGGLLLCSWPRGKKPKLPMIYAEEVWTGIEYQVATHAVYRGLLKEALDIVRHARTRYDGRTRNPFDEYEYGHWYARALSSFALLGAFSGARYDAVDRVLMLEPRISGDFVCLLCTAGGFGTVGVLKGEPFLDVVSGQIPISRIDYSPCL